MFVLNGIVKTKASEPMRKRSEATNCQSPAPSSWIIYKHSQTILSLTDCSRKSGGVASEVKAAGRTDPRPGVIYLLISTCF